MISTMKFLNLDGSWPAVVVIALFLLIPLTTLPGLFDAFFVVLLLVTAVLATLIALSVVGGLRRASSNDDASNDA